MKSIKRIRLVSALFISAVALDAHAALYDRGNGMIYDSSLNITWLQNMNVSGELMSWLTANSWATNLVYGGFSDWRLPSARFTSTPGGNAYDGNGNYGYNITRSELGHLYFVDLGNKAYYSTDGVPQSGWGLTNTSFVDAATGTTQSFINMSSRAYWEQEALSYGTPPPHSSTGTSMAFEPGIGVQTSYGWETWAYALAVRDGDVAAVPLPSAAFAFATSLFGLAAIRRRR